MERSLNPKHLSNTQNFSQVQENYILSYWKLKAIAKTFIPDTLLLGFTPHNISETNDFLFLDHSTAEEFFSRSYPIHNFNLFKNDFPINHKLLVKTLWKKNCFYPKLDHTPFLGHYTARTASNPQSPNEAINRHFFREGKLLHASTIQKNYLDSIYHFCLNQEIKLILVATPVHKNYYQKIPEIHQSAFNQIKSYYQDRQIPILDYSSTQYPDSFFLDTDHLNHTGATYFSTELEDLFARSHK